MLFNSYEFLLVFLPITWIVFRLLARYAQPRHCYVWLIFASLVFYAWLDYQLLGLLFFSLGFNYSLARLNTTAFSHVARLWLLGLGISVNVGLIAYYKYAGFAFEILDQLTIVRIDWDNPILPLAISFYTFEQIAFLVGCYRENGRTPRFLDYCFFIVFFPQLIAGPILHYKDIVPQISRPFIRVSTTQLSIGLTLVAIGLAKKVLMADELGEWFQRAHQVIVDGYQPTMLEAWLNMTCAALRVYFDYSGYADIAIGLALLFGLRLPLNFNSPFKATTVADFWRAWNMTLMRFLRNHVYLPMGGSRYGRARQLLAILATFTICGIWHGAGWSYTLWGFAVGVTVVADLYLSLRRGDRPRGYLGLLAGRAWVFLCFLLPSSLFLFSDLATCLTVFKSLVGLNALGLPTSFATYLSLIGIDAERLGIPVVVSRAYFGREHLMAVLAGLFVVYGLPNSYQLVARFRPTTAAVAAPPGGPGLGLGFRWHPTALWALIATALLLACLVSMRTAEEFFYFQF